MRALNKLFKGFLAMMFRKNNGLPQRLFKPLLVVCIVYLGYAFLSFALIATLGKYTLNKSLSDITGADVAVQQLWFNPFANSVTINNFSLSMNDESVIRVNRAYANVDLLPLFKGQLRLREIAISGPYVHLIRSANGELNLQHLLVPANKAEDAEEKPAKEGGAWPLSPVINRIVLAGGSIQVTDETVQPTVEMVFPVVDVEAQQLTLEKNAFSDFQLALELPKSGNIDIEGKVSANPFDLALGIDLTNIHLAQGNPWLMPFINGELSGGVLNASLSVKASGEPLNVALKGSANVADGSVKGADDQPLVGFSLLSADGFSLDYNSSNISLDQLTLKGLTGELEQFSDGRNSIGKLLKTAAEPKPSSAKEAEDVPAADNKQWQFRLKKITLDASSLLVVDHLLNPAYQAQLAPLTLTVDNLSNTDKAAKVDLESQLKLQPLNAKKPQPQLNFTGKLAGTMGLTLLDKGVRLQGSTQLSNVQLSDGKEQSVLVLDQIAVNSVQLDTVAETASVGELLIKGITATFETFVDGSTSIDQLLPSVIEPQQPASAPGPASQWRWQLDRLEADAKKLSFTDHTVEPAFHLQAGPLTAALTHLNSDGRKADLSVNGKLDDYANLSVNGTIAPLATPLSTDLSVNLTHYNMTPLSPYTGLFIGKKVKSGRLSLTSQVGVDGTHLTSRSEIAADKFYLGEKVASDQATKAPVGLGLSLLRNRDGLINLPLKVAGDLSDPSVSVHGLVLKALFGVLTKAATSPLSVLSLLPGGLSLDAVTFDVGSSELQAAQSRRLDKLAKMLKEHSKLAITLVGAANAADDRWLADQGVVETLRKQRLTTLARERANVVRSALVSQRHVNSEAIYMAQPVIDSKVAGVLLRDAKD